MATFNITCPCCNGRLTIDPGLEAVVAHEAPPRKSSGLGLGEAITSLKGEAAKREERFREQMKAEQNKGKVLDAMLQQALKKARDDRFIGREQLIPHLLAFRDELDGLAPGRLAAIVAATRGIQSLEAERTLLERLPECFAAYQTLPAADRRRVRHVLETIIEGMTEDLRRFPGEDETGLSALESRHDLDRYTYLVAGCVGEFWTEGHVAHRTRLKHWDLETMKALGIRFGKALQLTNVLRDIPRDLRQGRCYLPRHDLGLLGLEPKDLLDPQAGAAPRPPVVELLHPALGHYEAGRQYTLALPQRQTRM